MRKMPEPSTEKSLPPLIVGLLGVLLVLMVLFVPGQANANTNAPGRRVPPPQRVVIPPNAQPGLIDILSVSGETPIGCLTSPTTMAGTSGSIDSLSMNHRHVP